MMACPQRPSNVEHDTEPLRITSARQIHDFGTRSASFPLVGFCSVHVLFAPLLRAVHLHTKTRFASLFFLYSAC